jgi:hypothetical protein
MSDRISVDRFDDVRREWIARHQGWSTIQRRRAEQLGRLIRVRQRAQAAAVPDPHDDTLLPPILLRTNQSPASAVEGLALTALLVIAPLGWLGGYLVKCAVVRLIPSQLRGYPVAVLLWAGAAIGALTVALVAAVQRPGADLTQLTVMPWLCVQIAGVFVVAGVYGIAEGWLAVPASRLWLPRTPPTPAVTAEDAAAVLGGWDMTAPGLLDAQPLNAHGHRIPS